MKTPPHPSDRLARLCIWSVAHQDVIAGYFRIYVAGGVGVIILFFLAGLLSVEHFTWALIGSGLGTAGLMAALIRARRTVLLRIQDPALRRLALATMRAYIYRRERAVKAAGTTVGARSRLVATCGKGECRR